MSSETEPKHRRDTWARRVDAALDIYLFVGMLVVAIYFGVEMLKLGKRA